MWHIPVIAAAVALVVLFCAVVVIYSAMRPDDHPQAGLPFPPTTQQPGTTPGLQTRPTSSAPADPGTIEMPNVVGKNAAIAEDELKRLGFEKVQFGSLDVSDQLVIVPANWVVKEQSHKPGERLAADVLIVLGCTKAAV